MTAFSWERFEAVPLVAILRGFRPAQLGPLVEAVRDGGLTTLEVTMNSPDAAGQIRAALAGGGGQLNVGAGTVTSRALLEEALAAGASFIVTPTLQPALIAECVRRGVPVFPGALTPTEVAAAREHGARWVKVFPADAAGPAYLRRLKDLHPDLRLMPTGGVDLETIGSYRAAGADGFGVGSPLFDRARIAAGDWAAVAARCRAFRTALGGVRSEGVDVDLTPISPQGYASFGSS